MMHQVFLSLCGKSNILHPSIPTLFLAKLCSSYLGKWKLPQGYDTGITVYNSAVNKRVPLILRDKGIATWYICGPTVYAESHIGHASCYVKFDIIRRIMENIFGINVLLLMGITDIDDKIIKEANKVGKNISQVSKKYELDFFNDMAAMQIKPPSIICRVTDNIPLIISFCERLISKGYAYVTDEGNVYFMVSKGISADMLSNLPEDCQLVTDPLKKDQRDFAVWKAAKPDEPYWLSPWGKGRPGWHIECSAMASHIFGSQLDLHSGGYDLLFPHHTNEKSQSEAFHGCSQWVNYWMHSGLLQIDDSEKMSKSLKNTISIKDYLKKNSVNDFRILCLQSLYRKNISYNAETLAGAKGLHKKLHSFINDCELYVSGMIQNNCVDHSRLLSKLTSVKEQVTFSFSKDFNTSQALLNLVQLIDEVNRCLHCSSVNNSSNPEGSTAVAACASYVDSVLEMLGVNIICKKRLSREFVYQVDAIVEFRNEIRLLALSYNKKGGTVVDKKAFQISIDSAHECFKQKLNLIEKREVQSLNISPIVEVCDNFYQQVSDFWSMLYKTLLISSPYTLYICMIHSVYLNFICFVYYMLQFLILTEENMVEALNCNNRKLSSLFCFCDEFRSSLEKFGIGIKDKNQISTWFPLIK